MNGRKTLEIVDVQIYGLVRPTAILASYFEGAEKWFQDDAQNGFHSVLWLLSRDIKGVYESSSIGQLTPIAKKLQEDDMR